LASNTKKTPKLIDAINAVIDSKLCEMHTSLPAEIVSYDYNKNTATVKPTLKRKYKSETAPVELPLITNVPVAFQRMGEAHLRIPINPKDTGQLVFTERSIDGWLTSGGIIDPQDPRKHALSDAVFYPGLNPSNNPIKSSANEKSLEIKLKNSYIEITDDGKFKITNGNEELIDLIVQVMGKMVDEMNEQGTNDFTNTMFGPQQPINFANYTSLKNDYDALKTKFESLKG
jgi:hypothetical protein